MNGSVSVIELLVAARFGRGARVACMMMLALAAIAHAQSSFTAATRVTGPPQWPVLNTTSTPWTGAGTDFYACFPSVVGSDLDASTKIRSLFISSRAPTRVTVEVLKTAFDTTFIVTPGHYARVNIPIYDALNSNDEETILSKVVHVYSKELITVYGYSHNLLSSDGFVVYPTQTLGNSYFAMSTRNAVNYKVGHGGDPSLDTTLPNPRSEFAIVGTQNNTTVTFTLTATSYSGFFQAGSTYSIKLDRGQVYQIMARDTGVRLTTSLPDSTLNWWNGYAPWGGGPDCDLTGSYISSNKPIAVFSGHERASAPAQMEYDFAGISRDHLVEEMMPVSAWGKNYIVTSLGQDSKKGRRAGGDAIRILAGFDNTHVTVNGALAYTLNRGQSADFFSGNAALIQSDEPLLVAHFMQSSNTVVDPLGDPDLTLSRPIEDYAMAYTLPPWTDASIFTEPHLLVICDSSTTKTTLLNGAPLTGGIWNAIPGTAFDVGIFAANPMEQRVESPLPCYTETFAYGYEDSYAFAGGGDYPYVDSLLATDLDFKAVPVGQSKGMTGPLHSALTAKDTIHIYGYEWVSGDTSNFTLIGGMSQTGIIPPHGGLSLPYQFHPTAPRYYVATLRVWSDAVNPVFIKLQGNGIAPEVAVIPDTIDFGRVRLNTQKDSFFIIENLGTTDIALTDLNYQQSITDTDLIADPFKNVGASGMILLTSGGNLTIPDTVHFIPHKLGPHFAQIPIYWHSVVNGVAGQTEDTPAVVLKGFGVEPNVASSGHAFGSLRVDSASKVDTIAIVNQGNDATEIDSVTIVNPLPDFTVNLDTLPPTGPHAVQLAYEGNDTAVNFTVQFQPRSLGPKMLIVRIHTIDGDVIFDTLTGTGIEPLVLVNPTTIDFGTIRVDTGSTVAQPAPLSFTVSNTGTMAGMLDSLVYDSTKHFTVSLNKPGNVLQESLKVSGSLQGTVSFSVVDEGDFLDTVFLANDTRYRLYSGYPAGFVPMVILKAKVRTGPIGPDSLMFGTIKDCNLDSSDVLIHNPYPVEEHIDSIVLLSDTAGFSFRQPYNYFFLPINIPPDSNYPLRLYYSFPPDSLNGPQILKMGLYQRTLPGDSIVVDTVTAALTRQQRGFKLEPHLPSFASSANDVFDLRLPITVVGPRANVLELNSWTLSLQFSNDLFEPVGVDTTNALTVPDSTGTFTLTTHWDQSTRTYTIVVTGSAVSDPAKIANDLLLSILMRAYLTKDTVVTVTPTFTWARHPCAYNLQSFTLSIPYADECGDPTIRSFMRGDNPFFTLIGAFPNPVDRASGLSVGFRATARSIITAQIFNEAGEQTGEFQTTAAAGAGTLSLDAKLLPASGAAFIRVSATPVSGGITSVKMVSVEVAK